MSAQLPPEITESLNALKGITDDFLKKNDERFSSLRARVSDLEMHRNRAGLGGGSWQGDSEGRDELNKALKRYIKTGNDALLREKAMSVGSDPEGGYWVPSVLANSITQRIFESSPIRQIARIVSIETDAFEEPLDIDELAASWVSETGARTETTTPEVGLLRIPVHEIYASPKVTQKLLDDSKIDIDAWLTEKIGDKFGRSEATAFVSGDGIGKPRGFLTYAAGIPTATAWNVIEQTNSGASGAFASSNPGDALITMVFNLKAGYRRGAVWLMNSKTIAATRKLKDGQGNYLWQTSVIAGQPDLLLGYPVLAAEDMPNMAANSLSIAFGNFQRAYTVVDRHPMRMLRDPYTAKPHVLFYTYRRVGGDVVNFEAIKLMKFAA